MSELRKAAEQAQSALAAWSIGEQLNATEVNDLIERLEASLAQPEPEPGAHQTTYEELDRIASDLHELCDRQAMRITFLENQRKPLTEEEIENLGPLSFTWRDMVQFARAIERAHGIGVNK